MKRFFPSLFLLLFWNIGFANAQHFMSGSWTGNYSGGAIAGFLGIIPRKLVVDIEVLPDNSVTGSSHLYYRNKNNYEHYFLHGTFNPADSSIVFSEDSVIAVHSALGISTCTGTYTMKLQASDTNLHLKGKWKDNTNMLFGCGTSGAFLDKPVKKKQPKAPDCFTQFAVDQNDKNLKRKVEIQKLVELETDERDSIKIELLDNAEIDGDVVSVYINDCRLVQAYKLKKEPRVFYFSIPKGVPVCNIKMAAESMGSIPPCTALMNIITKHNRYEINLTSSMSNNSVVQFFMKE